MEPPIMEDYFLLLDFFRNRPARDAARADYDLAFLNALTRASSAREASVWSLTAQGRLKLVAGTNVTPGQIGDLELLPGEGVGGAALVSRRAVAVEDAWSLPIHDRRVDNRIGFRTLSMISAPILYGHQALGVVNILNHATDGPFPPIWQERLTAVASIYGATLALAGRPESSARGGRPGKPPPETTGLPGEESASAIVGASGAIGDALHLCIKAGACNLPVLVLGETGTGKELAARRIHLVGPRAQGPFVAVNCAGLPETILESELFGHVKGAFSGASAHRRGKFVAASGGTLFLDEIADMSPTCQAKILRALQEGTVTPVGSDEPVRTDVRVVAATNRDLREAMAGGNFREDLYYRLCGIEIVMPPLRQRRQDIPLLAAWFIRKAARENRVPVKEESRSLSREAVEVLLGHNWPGNVRELEQAVYATLAVAETEIIGREDLPGWLCRGAGPLSTAPAPPAAAPGPARETPSTHAGEGERYLRALEETRYPGTGRWNLAAAARELGVPRKTLGYRLKKLGLLP
ncbi:MAG: sigma 54-interacting transcriptional regulator [Proteobacteria bacterium]|nr:sigma 54-interacting transcriptional regulator [Pseudomonadota bacterium]